MDYLTLLNESYAEVKDLAEHDLSKLEFIGQNVFDFTTYDDTTMEYLTIKALEVCIAITAKETFDYIKKSKAHHVWYITMCNMPFFMPKLNWGSSIRGAWWDQGGVFTIKSRGLYENGKQVFELRFTGDEWEEFMYALMTFITGPKVEKPRIHLIN